MDSVATALASTSPLPYQTFRFMDLPAELRVRVYEVLLTDDNTYIIPHPNIRPGRPSQGRKPFYPGILRVSRTIFNEALPILYGKNAWMIRTFPLLRCVPQLTEYIGKHNAALIRHVFTIARSNVTLDEEIIKSTYRELGIKWDKLHVWGVKVRGDEVDQAVERLVGEADRRAGEGKGWVMSIDEAELKKLGIRDWWFEFEAEEERRWLVKRGSRGPGHGMKRAQLD